MKYPIVNSPFAAIQPSIFPPSRAACCVGKVWSVPGVACASGLRVVVERQQVTVVMARVWLIEHGSAIRKCDRARLLWSGFR